MKRPSLLDILGGANRNTLLWLYVSCLLWFVASFFELTIYLSIPAALAALVFLERIR